MAPTSFVPDTGLTFKLDGKTIPYQRGETIIVAAARAGIEIPHYCWHPGLSIAANCRMCLVQITSGRQMQLPVLNWDEAKGDFVQATKPKLQPACQIEVQEGMEVSTMSAEVKEAQRAVQEFLLLNHPVDCPICDQSGECKLQDYWLEHQQELKRKRTEPVHKPKAVRFGETIVYDAERCVMCTRCIRFCDEIVGDHALDMRERGNRNEIVLAPGRELDHKYTLMTEHVCPVGALTSRDFRFKARVWFLKSQPGVCSGCARGCNTHIDYDPRYNRVYRLRPRDNMAVNRYWMCDDGMMTYKEVHENRVLAARVVRGGDQEEVPIDEAITVAVKQLQATDGARVGVVLNAQQCSEDNYAAARLARQVFNTDFLFLAANGGWAHDNILRSVDNNPNRKGAEFASGNAELGTIQDLLVAAEKGELDAVLFLGPAGDTVTSEQLEALSRLASVVWLGANRSPIAEFATVVIPIASWAEMSGTYTNENGDTQMFKRAIHAPGTIEPGWRVLMTLADGIGKPLGFGGIDDLRTAMTKARTTLAPPPVTAPPAGVMG